MSVVERTITVYEPMVGQSLPGRRGGVPNHMVTLTYEGCEVESRNTYKGVPCCDLPAVWAAEDRRQSA